MFVLLVDPLAPGVLRGRGADLQAGGPRRGHQICWRAYGTLLELSETTTLPGVQLRAADLWLRFGGTLLPSAPDNWRWRSAKDRRNLSIWAVRRNGSAPAGLSLVGQWRVFAGPAAYSSLTRAGDFVMWEGGATYRYASVMVAPTGAAAHLRVEASAVS